MNKHQADAIMRQIKASPWDLIGYHKNERGNYTVTATSPANECVVFNTPEQWAERSNGATPTPGARLKYPELGATAQHSVTLPESCWQDIEALGVNPKGKNVRSEGVFRLWQAWKEATVSR